MDAARLRSDSFASREEERDGHLPTKRVRRYRSALRFPSAPVAQTRRAHYLGALPYGLAIIAVTVFLWFLAERKNPRLVLCALPNAPRGTKMPR
jgi:hypothetical protein